MNEWSKIVLLYFSKVFQSLITGVGVPLLRTGWWWWSCEFTCVTIKGENGVPTTKSNGCVSAPHGSFERYDIIGQSHSYLGFHDTVLSGSHPSFLTTAPCPLLFTTFSLPFSSSLLTTGIHSQGIRPWLLVLSFSMYSISGLIYSCVLLTILTFRPPSKATILQNNVPSAPQIHNIWNRTQELKATLPSDFLLWRYSTSICQVDKAWNPRLISFYLPSLWPTHPGQHQVPWMTLPSHSYIYPTSMAITLVQAHHLLLQCICFPISLDAFISSFPI